MHCFWRSSKFVFVVSAWLLVSLGVAGCDDGSGMAEVTGKLTKGGQPLEVGEKGLVQLTFHRLENGEVVNVFSGDVDSEGNFRTKVPPGAYRVEVQQLETYPGGNDLLEGKYGAKNSPVEVEVEGAEELNIDLDDYAA